jgi:uncharacterized membrane protein YeaQ/YmgE (transglycosylase-associated protein family)
VIEFVSIGVSYSYYCEMSVELQLTGPTNLGDPCPCRKFIMPGAGGAYDAREQRSKSEIPGLIAKPWLILDDVDGGKSMFHLIWYVLIGLISGVIAKSVMHVHITFFWTIVVGIIGSIIGGALTHMFSRPTNERYHPAGLIFSTLGAILILFICYKLKIHFPAV